MKRKIAFFCFSFISLIVKADDYDFSIPEHIMAFAYSNNGKLIAAAEIAGLIKLYDASTLEIIKTFDRKVLVASHIIFSPDDLYIAVASYGIIVFEIETGNVIFEHFPDKGNPSRRIYSISYSFDGQRIVSGDREGIIRIYDIKKGIETVTIKATGLIESISFSPDGRSVLSTTFYGLKIWDAENGNELYTLSENIPFIMASVLYSLNEKLIFLGYRKIRGGTVIEIYNANNLKILYSYTLINHHYGVDSFYNIPNNSQIMFSTRGKQIIIMDIYNGNIINNIEISGHISVSPDGRNIVYSEDGVSINIRNVN